MDKLDQHLGVLPQLLDFRVQRQEVIAQNIANVDTPNFKAKDVSFSLNQDSFQQQLLSIQEHYRNPYQRSADGNTVELHIEQAKFAQNNAEYQATLKFLRSKISGLRQAIEG